MTKKLLLVLSAATALLISGCGKKPMYEYSDYSESYYNLKQHGDAEATLQWKTTLERSIQMSNEQAIRIPPGVNANLGYLYLKMNSTEQAISYFKAEKALYPESTVFMQTLIKKAELMNENKGNS